MARYRKVEVKTWNDGKFRDLSPMPPCGQGLWLWFLTGTRTTNIPGVVVGTDVVMAAELRWPVEAFREAFREAFDKGMAKGDWEAGLVWLPNASRPGDNRNKPESPNVIRSWRDTWDEIPECALKLDIWQQLKAFAEAFGKGFEEAFMEACRKPWVKPSPNQKQEQEQKQEQKHTQSARGVNEGKGFREGSGEAFGTADAWREITECDSQAYEHWLQWRVEEHDVVPPRVRIQDAKFLGGKGTPEQQRAFVDELIRRRFKRLHDPAGFGGVNGTAHNGRKPTFDDHMAELDAYIATADQGKAT